MVRRGTTTRSPEQSFAPLQAELGLLGHRSVAVDLPGHGFDTTYPRAYQAPQDRGGFATTPGAIKGVTLAGTAAHLIGILERAKRNGPVTSSHTAAAA
ncbi:hypothetical protein FM21_24515 [Streptomyces mutabilis]|uniref:Alpha/beta hydrolase n=1 Tax=Streptomyces mutabilis TaxID=67332 RepID=A0A086MYH5_9ACTN|nr:hypothetical protein FM21_24515 [Streptomyces mutabilis]